MTLSSAALLGCCWQNPAPSALNNGHLRLLQSLFKAPRACLITVFNLVWTDPISTLSLVTLFGLDEGERVHAVEPNSFIIVLLLLFLHCTKSLSLVWYVHVCLPEHVEEARQILL